MTHKREKYGGVAISGFGPLMIMRFDPGWSIEDFSKGASRMLVLAPRRFAVISEMRRVRPAGALGRKSMSEYLAGVEEEVNERVIASAVVADSMLTRGAIRAIRWMMPPRYPLLTFESMGGAVQACLSHLAEAGVSPTAEEELEAKIYSRRLQRDREGQPEAG